MAAAPGRADQRLSNQFAGASGTVLQALASPRPPAARHRRSTRSRCAADAGSALYRKVRITPWYGWRWLPLSNCGLAVNLVSGTLTCLKARPVALANWLTPFVRHCRKMVW